MSALTEKVVRLILARLARIAEGKQPWPPPDPTRPHTGPRHTAGAELVNRRTR